MSAEPSGVSFATKAEELPGFVVWKEPVVVGKSIEKARPAT